MPKNALASLNRFSGLWSRFLDYSQRCGEEKTNASEKWRNKRRAYWFHSWKANTEPVILATKCLDSDHQVQNQSMNLCPTLPTLVSCLALPSACPSHTKSLPYNPIPECPSYLYWLQVFILSCVRPFHEGGRLLILFKSKPEELPDSLQKRVMSGSVVF